MFCKKCGAKCDDEAKFCSNCGTTLSSEPATYTPSPEKSLEAKVFLSEQGILVSDAMFKTASGASYPIRNISSVAVEVKPAGIFFLFAIALTLFGLFLMIGSVVAGFIFLALSIPFWWAHSNRPHFLKVGAGGVLQTAIESSDRAQLHSIAKAINDAILYIQRGR